MRSPINPSTHKTQEAARKSFEAVTGKTPRLATLQDIETWLDCLRDVGRAVSTRRTYASFVAQLAGLTVALPKRESRSRRVLREEEIQKLLRVIDASDYAWLAAMLLIGPEKTLKMQWGWLNDPLDVVPMAAYLVLVQEAKRCGYDVSQFGYWRPQAHWIGGVDLRTVVFPMDQHEINRRLKRAARNAGIGTAAMNVTTLRYAHEQLLHKHGDADALAKTLGIGLTTERPTRKADLRLHGIGRRRSLMKLA